MNSAVLPFLWLLNGILAALYLLAENLSAVLLLAELVWSNLYLARLVKDYYAPLLQPYLLASSILAMAAAVWAPQPAPFFLALMTSITLVVLLGGAEKFNPAAVVWSLIRGMGLYALAGLGLAVLLAAGVPVTGVLGQGQNYIALLAGIVLYATPVGYIALLLKEILVQGPVADPVKLISSVRAPAHPGVSGGSNAPRERL